MEANIVVGPPIHRASNHEARKKSKYGTISGSLFVVVFSMLTAGSALVSRKVTGNTPSPASSVFFTLIFSVSLGLAALLLLCRKLLLSVACKYDMNYQK